MPYTLSMGLVWVASAIVLGIVMGWLMRSVLAKRQIERARSNHLDTVELERLRTRVVELELGRSTTTRSDPDPDPDRDPDPERGSRSAPDEVDAVPDVPDVPESAPGAGPSVDLGAAVVVLGAPVELDDLTVVNGIGPKVADLCTGIGIKTWHDLAHTEVSLLRTMLHDAGPRFRSHDPSTWPEQAALLATGQWAEFRAFTDRLADGSPR